MRKAKKVRCRHEWAHWYDSYGGQEGEKCVRCMKGRVVWSAEDQALWVAALDIVRMLYADPFDLVMFATVWRNALILGERRGR